MLYVAQLLRGRPMLGLRRELVIAVIAALALWDPTVSDAMIDLPLERIFDPVEPLAVVAHSRGWTSLPDDTAACRHEGMVQRFADKDQIHSAVLAASGDVHSLDELRRRVWSAQVGVLLPFVEGRRRELLEGLDGQLVGPFRFDDGVVIQDARDLEIGQIEYQLAKRGRRVPQTIRLLKQIRNRLAHLEVVTGDLLQNADFTKLL
jgi:hypothetical protein